MKQIDANVMKALSPEEMTMLSNIQSIIGELIGQNQEAPPEESVEVSKQDEMETTEEIRKPIDEEEKVEKEIVTSESDSTTASDDAEERIDETQTEITEDGVNEVAKALLQVLKGKKKQDKKPINPLVSAIKQVVDVQKSNQEQLNELTTAFSQIIKGMGIAQQMEVHKSQTEKKNSQNPIYAEDMEKVFKSILDSVKTDSRQENSEVKKSNNDIIRDNLRNPNFLKSAIANKF